MNVEINNKDIKDSNVKTDVSINVSSKNLIQFVDLPNLDTTVYGRNDEAKILADFFAANKRHCAVVAPSCFGKTFLIRKFLQNVSANDELFKDSFEKIIYFNCREITGISSVVDKFETCLGGKFEASNLLTHIQNEKILCIFDNFESWVEQAEFTAFIHKIFNTQNKLRTIFVTREMPDDDNFRSKVEELTEISRKLFKGLDQAAALEFVKTEGKKAELDLVAPEKLISFFAEVAYIPQAIRSMIKFLEIKRKSFDEFISTFKAGFTEFEKSKDRFSDVNDEFRPTLYLLTLQIEVQDERAKDLLSVLAFFASEVPELVIEKFKPAVSAVEKEVIHSLMDNWLVEENTVWRGETFRYYSPHPMICQVVRESLPTFENKNSDNLESFARELYNAAYRNHQRRHNYEEAINLYLCVEKLLEHLVNVKGRNDLAKVLAISYLNKGELLRNLRKLFEAILEYEKAQAILQILLEVQGHTEIANTLAKTYTSKGNALCSLGNPIEAILEHDKAIEIRQELAEGQDIEFLNGLAKAYMSKGVALDNLRKLNEAILEYGKAIAIQQVLVEVQGRTEIEDNLAMAYMNKGTAFWRLGKLNEAILEHDKGIAIRQVLVEEQGRSELANNLAMAYGNKGNVLWGLGQQSDAIELYGDAINLWEESLQRGEVQNLPEYAICLGNRFGAHSKAGNDDLAAKDMQRLYELLEVTKQDKRIAHLSQAIQAEIDKWS